MVHPSSSITRIHESAVSITPLPDSDGTRSVLLVTTIARMLEDFLLPLAEHLRDRGWRVDALAHGATHSAPIAKCCDGAWEAPWSRNPLDPRNLLSAVKVVRELVANRGYDVVHVHTPVAAFVTRLALRSCRYDLGCPVVYTAHGFHFHARRPWLSNAPLVGLEKLAGRWTDQLVVINRDDEEQALQYGIVPPQRLVRMDGIGIDPTHYDSGHVPESEVKRVREEIGVAEDEPLFVMVAEFTPQKQQAQVLDALEHTRHEIKLAFVGDGKTFEATRAKARERGLEGSRAHFLGRRQDVPALLEASTATVLYSQREGLSRAVMEAMCMSRPVIGSNVRGIRDLIADGAGLIVDPDRPTELAEAMDHIVEHPERAREMGERGRRCIAGPYLQHEIARKHEELYETVIRQGCRERG